jgi:hypothetical protein
VVFHHREGAFRRGGLDSCCRQFRGELETSAVSQAHVDHGADGGELDGVVQHVEHGAFQDLHVGVGHSPRAQVGDDVVVIRAARARSTASVAT